MNKIEKQTEIKEKKNQEKRKVGRTVKSKLNGREQRGACSRERNKANANMLRAHNQILFGFLN